MSWQGLNQWTPVRQTAGYKVSVKVDPQDGKLLVNHQQDCTALVEHNREWQKQRQTGLLPKIGSIPCWAILKWREEHGVDVFNKNHMPAVLRLLSDPDYRDFRTIGGRIR